MPITHDPTNLIRLSSDLKNIRTLILHHQTTNAYVYADFDYPYDDAVSVAMVDQLFEPSFSFLQHHKEQCVSADQLPIIRHLGRWKITLVARSPQGNIKISDAEHKPIDAYLGLT